MGGPSRARQQVALLLQVLRKPEDSEGLDAGEWDLLLTTARRGRLLGRLAALLGDLGVLERIPEAAAEQLEAGLVIARHRQMLARWEVDRIQRAIGEVPLILLKGAAYLLADLPPSRGRTFADIDILVRQEDLKETERRLTEAGWVSAKLDPYDQRYYREWMHELPPLRHPRRHIEVDVHHTILPRTSRLRPDPGALWRESAALGSTGLGVLSPADMALHAVTHLFYDSELKGNLRDLVDVDDLLRHSAKSPGFWEELCRRAKTHELLRPLFWALRYGSKCLGTPVPDSIRTTVAESAPGTPVVTLMDRLVALSLFPWQPDTAPRSVGIARWLLFVRSHWLKMPPWLLARHLFHKAFFSPKESSP
jgi:hypothetical protein